MLEPMFSGLVVGFFRAWTGARSLWTGCEPLSVKRIYYANHSSHGDFILIWSSLPAELRRQTRPVAAADYWDRGPVRRYIIHRMFNGVLIKRQVHGVNPLMPLLEALENSDSLILFPEGTRNQADEGLLPFKSGIYKLAQAHPETELVPVWIDNLNRIMPKGRLLPLPLLCTLTFGTPLKIAPEETKRDFLGRLRDALTTLAGEARNP